jgi:hypothetical protein
MGICSAQNVITTDFLTQCFVLSCQYNSINAPYSLIHSSPTLNTLQTLTASLKNDTFPVITRSTFGQSTKGFPLIINSVLPRLNKVHFPCNHITYVTFNTNLLQNVFVCQLLLRQVSASVPGHLQGARDFLVGCNLHVNVRGRDSTNKLSYK